MLAALKRWREHLGLGPYPSSYDDKPLFLKKVIGGYTSSLASVHHISKFISECIAQSIIALMKDNLSKEAMSLKKIGLRSFRNVKISESSIAMNKKIEAAITMYEESKKSVKEICNTLNISLSIFYKHKKLTVNNRKTKQSHEKNKMILLAKEMHYEYKIDVKEICSTLNISKTTFYRYMSQCIDQESSVH